MKMLRLYYFLNKFCKVNKYNGEKWCWITWITFCALKEHSIALNICEQKL
jgi:hypothetical protein